MKACRALLPDCDEPVQFCAVSVWRWRAEWGDPKLLFREMTTVELAQIDEVNALVVAAQRLRSELDPSSMADEALYRLIDAALAPFEETPDA